VTLQVRFSKSGTIAQLSLCSSAALI
jgi:hypothetical protein